MKRPRPGHLKTATKAMRSNTTMGRVQGTLVALHLSMPLSKGHRLPPKVLVLSPEEEGITEVADFPYS